MDEVIDAAAGRMARPYGPLGLLLSILGVFAVSLVLLGLAAGLFALVEGAIYGWAEVKATFSQLTDGGSADQVATMALLAGSAAYLAASVAVLLMARLRAGAAWRDLLGWAPFQTGRTFWSLLMGAIVYQMVAGALVRHIHPEAKNWLVFPEGPAGMASAFLLVVILAPLCEELLFRGWVYTALRWRFGFSVAIWVTAVLFALAHWESTHLYALAILPMGLLLGWLRERTGSTRATILFHSLYNCAGLAVSFLGKL